MNKKGEIIEVTIPEAGTVKLTTQDVFTIIRHFYFALAGAAAGNSLRTGVDNYKKEVAIEINEKILKLLESKGLTYGVAICILLQLSDYIATEAGLIEPLRKR